MLLRVFFKGRCINPAFPFCCWFGHLQIAQLSGSNMFEEKRRHQEISLTSERHALSANSSFTSPHYSEIPLLEEPISDNNILK